MAECEICGSEANGKANIDGAVVNVCDKCSKFGKKVVESAKIKKRVNSKEEDKRYIDPDYPLIIKKARENKDMKIEQLARKINEKESVISRLERGHLSPSFGLAKKLELFFGIKLILEYNDVSYSSTQKEDSSLTIGDVIDLGELDD